MIATFYIPKASLPYLLDHTVIGTVVRLGGHNIYHFKEDDNTITLTKIEKKTDYIPQFYGEDIECLSALVGKNGAGKTSILRQINYPIDETSHGVLLVWEEIVAGNLIIKLINQTAKNVVAIEEIEVVKTLDFANVLYYSPVIDFELKSSRSSINPSTKFEATLQDYYLKTLHQQTLLLGSPLLSKIIASYQDFPSFGKIEVKVHNSTKDSFRETYILANFANTNRGDALINEIEGDILTARNSEKVDYRFSKVEYIRMLEGYVHYLKADSFTDKLNQLFNIPVYKTTDKHNRIHNGDNFIKNLEILLLTYLHTGAIFPMNGLGGSYNYDNLLAAEDFSGRLDEFTKQYIVQRSDYIYGIVKSRVKSIALSKSEEIIQIIKNDKLSSLGGGIDFNAVKKEIIKNITHFVKIKEFYVFVQNIQSNGESIQFNLKEDYGLFTEFNLRYKEIISILNRYSHKEVILFDFFPDKKLSNGEKSLLDLFASLYSYVIENKNNKQICKDNQVLILDEPELGYHPLWKKKFVLAITKVLPVLFSELVPVKYDKEGKTYNSTEKGQPNLQIIFSTHDSLTLSDILFENTVFLDKNGDDKTFISCDKKRTFGANVSDLLADSFFVENGLIGEFAKIKIDETIDWLHSKENMNDSGLHQLVIEKIDEPIIQRKLAQMFSEKVNTDLARKLLEKELLDIQIKLSRM